MIFEKFNSEPIVLDRTRTYEQRVHFKPRGFWLNVMMSDYGWPEWCKDNDFYLDNLAVRHEVTVADSANVLWLSDKKSLLDFHNEYGAPILTGLSMKYPDWERVAKEYDGLVVSPYHRGITYDLENMHFGLEMTWYTTFDVASACIWNLEAIERIDITP